MENSWTTLVSYLNRGCEKKSFTSRDFFGSDSLVSFFQGAIIVLWATLTPELTLPNESLTMLLDSFGFFFGFGFGDAHDGTSDFVFPSSRLVSSPTRLNGAVNALPVFFLVILPSGLGNFVRSVFLVPGSRFLKDHFDWP
ncbi:MAG: hypothetical protein KDB27_10245 [Planctomycetales bacterium]|nr:hypothetical protein [Planctomycetales bacterium]